MAARHILAALALVFAVAAAARWLRNARRNTRRNTRRIDAAARTWLLVALVFAAVAAWLQWHTS